MRSDLWGMQCECRCYGVSERSFKVYDTLLNHEDAPQGDPASCDLPLLMPDHQPSLSEESCPQGPATWWSLLGGQTRVSPDSLGRDLRGPGSSDQLVVAVVCHHNAVISQLPPSPDTHPLWGVTCINLNNPPSKPFFTYTCIHTNIQYCFGRAFFKPHVNSIVSYILFYCPFLFNQYGIWDLR